MISIIIPHYNSSSGLIENLEKLQQQSDKDFEILIIDDCSLEDEYKRICNAINKIKLNIKIFRNSINQGPGFSRNRGIIEARGEYLTFLDADDYFEVDFISKFNEIINLFFPDMVICNYFSVSGPNKYEQSILSTREKVKSGYINKKEAFVYIKGAPWAKCYKRDIILNNNINFLPIKRSEDLPFTKVATMNCNKIYYIAESLYNYVSNDNSLMHNTSLLDENNCIKAIDKIKKELIPEYSKEFRSILNYEFIYSIVFTKLLKNESKKNIISFLKENKISFTKYDFYYKPYIFIVFILIRLRFLCLLRLISNYRERRT